MLLFAACSSSQSPVSSRGVVDSALESERLGGRLITIVQRGDTWYRIGFENSISVANLSAWNGMTPADKLAVGQRLRLTKPIGFKEPKKTAIIIDRTPKTVTTQQTKSSSSNIAKNTPIQANSAEPVSTKSKLEATLTSQNVRWSWPLKGKIVTQFSIAKGRKGIDISAAQNKQIKTAAAGKVVYQGNGIKGYNNLIIIKHNEQLLSAYAHNQKVFVKEGQFIQQGQVISTVGLKNGKPLLHFEIRRDGKPVNPLSYLR